MATLDPIDAGLPGSLRALAVTLMMLVSDRVELAIIELQEERARAKQKFLLMVLATFFFAMGMVTATALVILLFWETHQILAVGGLTVVYFAIGFWSLIRLRQMLSNNPPPFTATINEFVDDLKQLRGSDESIA
jgi:uncharacterized membrane protein YqjE